MQLSLILTKPNLYRNLKINTHHMKLDIYWHSNIIYLEYQVLYKYFYFNIMWFKKKKCYINIFKEV